MRGVRIGRLLGIPIEVRYSFLLMLVLAYYAGVAKGVGPLMLALLLLMCASVLVHELAHAWVAQRLKVPVLAIDLHFFGGAARMARLPERPRDEALIAIAGPAASFLLAGIGEICFQFWQTHFWNYFIFMNLLLGGFNCAPALPLDGGRILRALLCGWMDKRRATEVAVKISRGICALLAIWAVYSGETIAVVFAIFFWVSAGSELQAIAAWRPVDASQLGFCDASDANVEVLDRDGRPAGRRSAALGSTFVIEEHRSDQGKRWVVRGEDGQVLIVTDTPLA